MRYLYFLLAIFCLGQMSAQVQLTKAEYDELNDNLHNLETQVNSLQDSLLKYQKLKETHKKLQIAFDNLKIKNIDTQSELDQLKIEFSKFQSLQEQLSKVNTESETLQQELDLKDDKISNLQQEIDNQKRLNNQLNDDKDILVKKLDKANTSFKKKEKELAKLNEKNNQLNAEVQKLTQKLKEEYPKLIADKKKAIKGKINDISDAKTFNDELVKQLYEINVEFLEEKDKEYVLYHQLRSYFDLYNQSKVALENDINLEDNRQLIAKLKSIKYKNPEFKTLLNKNIKLLEGYCDAYITIEEWFTISKVESLSKDKYIKDKIGKLKTALIENWGNYPYIINQLDNYKKKAKNPFIKDPKLNCKKK